MIIKISKKSLVQFQFGDTESVIAVDIVAISDMWHEINFKHRVLDGDNWVVPPDKLNELATDRLNFVQSIIAEAYPEGAPVPTLSRIEAEEFIHQVREETDKLRNFIYPKIVEPSSVPENTEQVNFSQ